MLYLYCLFQSALKSGKTSLIYRLLNDGFTKNIDETFGMDIQEQIEKTVCVRYCDFCSGLEGKQLVEKCFKNTPILFSLLCFDVTNRESFDLLKENCYTGTLAKNKFIVGTCIDKINTKINNRQIKRQVSCGEAQKLAKELSAEYMELSAKEDTNVKPLSEMIKYEVEHIALDSVL